MIRTIRAVYFGRLLREKILLTGLLAMMAALWLSSFCGRAGVFLTGWRNLNSELTDQAQWLANRKEIENSARQAASRLDPSRTLDGTRLLAEMSAMSREAGLSNTSGGESQDVGSGQFTIHTLEFNILKADWSSLKSFYIALQRRSPYIGIEQFQTTVDRANPTLLNVNLRVSSVEIARGSAP
jgi:hypothetical protein